jgi:hypothetical protein
VNTVKNLRVPQNIVKSSSRCTTGSFSRMAKLHGVRQWDRVEDIVKKLKQRRNKHSILFTWYTLYEK